MDEDVLAQARKDAVTAKIELLRETQGLLSILDIYGEFITRFTPTQDLGLHLPWHQLHSPFFDHLAAAAAAKGSGFKAVGSWNERPCKGYTGTDSIVDTSKWVARVIAANGEIESYAVHHEISKKTYYGVHIPVKSIEKFSSLVGNQIIAQTLVK